MPPYLPHLPHHRRRARLLAGAMVALTTAASGVLVAAALPAHADASDGIFSNPAAIAIPETTPNSASVTVPSGMTSLSRVALTLTDVNHSNINNVTITVTSPSNHTERIVCNPSSLGGSAAPSHVTVTFSSDGTGEPACPSGSLANFLGEDPTGSWTLDAQDPTTTGSIAGGFTLAITQAPTVTTQPQEQAVVSGQPASFTVGAVGTPTPTVQWQKSTDQGSSWAGVTGATTDTLTLAHTTLADDSTAYRAVYTSSAGTQTSDIANLFVSPRAPAVSTQPVSITVAAGHSATFTAAADGDPAPTLQWQVSTNGGSTYDDIAGAHANSYTVSAPSLADSRNRYRAVFSNTAGDVTTSAAVLTVTGHVPSAPLQVAATQTGAGQVTVTWSAPTSPGSSAITSYEPGYGAGQRGDGMSVAAGARRAVFSHLTPGAYTFSVAAANAAGWGPRVSVPLNVAAPAATPKLDASVTSLVAGDALTLSGSGPASARVTLQREVAGTSTFTTLATLTTNRFGGFSYTLRPTATATYRVRTASGRLSAARKVVAHNAMTLTATRAAVRTYTLSGNVSPAVTGQGVVLSFARGTSTTYTSLGTVHTDAHGHWTLRHVFPAGVCVFKAVSIATAHNAAGIRTLRATVS